MKIKRLKSGIYKHLIPIYNQRLYISIGRDAAEKQFGEDGTMPEEMAAGMRTLNDNGRFAALVIIGSQYKDINTVAHEAVHVAMDVLDHVEATYSPDNQEPLAYLVGYIAEVIQKCIDMEAS